MIPPIHTPRLTLRNFAQADWAALLEMILQYEASAVAAYDHAWPLTPAEIQQVVNWFASSDHFLAVCLNTSERFIGLVSLNPEGSADPPEFNLGYIFNSEYHGQGYAAEACRAVLTRAFTQLQAVRILSGTAAQNPASCRLLEKLGFSKTGEQPASFRNAPTGQPILFTGCSYALSHEAWQAAAARNQK